MGIHQGPCPHPSLPPVGEGAEYPLTPALSRKRERECKAQRLCTRTPAAGLACLHMQIQISGCLFDQSDGSSAGQRRRRAFWSPLTLLRNMSSAPRKREASFLRFAARSRTKRNSAVGPRPDSPLKTSKQLKQKAERAPLPTSPQRGRSERPPSQPSPSGGRRASPITPALSRKRERE